MVLGIGEYVQSYPAYNGIKIMISLKILIIYDKSLF